MEGRKSFGSYKLVPPQEGNESRLHKGTASTKPARKLYRLKPGSNTFLQNFRRCHSTPALPPMRPQPNAFHRWAFVCTRFKRTAITRGSSCLLPRPQYENPSGSTSLVHHSVTLTICECSLCSQCTEKCTGE